MGKKIFPRVVKPETIEGDWWVGLHKTKNLNTDTSCCMKYCVCTVTGPYN